MDNNERSSNMTKTLMVGLAAAIGWSIAGPIGLGLVALFMLL